MKRREFLRNSVLLGATASLLPGVGIANGSNVPEVSIPKPVVSIPTRRAGDRFVWSVNGIAYPFRWCPAGTFMMGISASNLHQVTLTRGFLIQETLITQEQWENVTENNSSRLRASNLPMEGASWDDCQDYVQKLNGLNVAPKGYQFSLPTEAQWEYAYRAEKTRETFFHSTNEWGMRYMYDNILEWCSDWYERYPSDNAIDPTGGQSGKTRVIRGRYGNGDDRRAGASPKYRGEGFSFRLILVHEG